jgi:hypothetical protein
MTFLALLSWAVVAPAQTTTTTTTTTHRVTVYQSPSGTEWYRVTTTQSGPPVYTYTVPSTSNKVYVYSASAPTKEMGQVKIEVPAQDTAIFIDGDFLGVSQNVMKVALDPGTHKVELRDNQGKTLFTGNLDVTAGQTTELKPDMK